MTLEALNTQATCEHPTPLGILFSARQTFIDGFIDLDVASSDEMNKYVEARRFYTKESDGLHRNWKAKNIFLNPPGSQTPKGQPRGPSPLDWLDRLVAEYREGNVIEAIYVGYNGPETLSKRPMHFRVATGVIHSSVEHCAGSDDGVTNNGRIKFLGDRPFFPSVILYFGPRSVEFFSNFSRFGTRIIVP